MNSLQSWIFRPARPPHIRAEAAFDEAEELLPLSDLHPAHRENYPESTTVPHRLSGLRRVFQGRWKGGVAVVTIICIVCALASSDIARGAVDALYARQSTTLAKATARYSLRRGRSPPPYYERWFQFAQEKRCLIDEYDQIHRDFKPFYQLADDDPAYFQNMIDRAAQQLADGHGEITRVEIRDGEVYMAGPTAYGAYWPDTIRHFSEHLPNMTLFMNGRDEPRVAYNYRAPGARKAALSPNDSTPFDIAPRPTADFFAQQSGCLIPLETTGFGSSVNEESSFLISSAKPGFTTDLYPMLSMTKVSPCFSDILFPSEYYYERSWWYGHYAYPDNVWWDEKKSQIYWRGMSNSGMILGANYHHFARFKLVELGPAHPDLMDVAITTFAETMCKEGCDREALIAEYNITGEGQPRENLYGFKYALDVDGTTFSGRFLGLLRSGSLVFKSTLFEEYFNDWLRPYEHFIPVLPDLSNLIQQIEWANAHPEEARLIQQRGLEVARRVVTDDQNDCYLFSVMLEWARLQGYADRSPA
ncbi:glycosyl transferase family 90-domain-containing protein [Mycena epipterygia]|nr:glycosyl transferase family 90-domain-containing protein [Mycena epipterygia]